MAKKILCGLAVVLFGVLILLGNFDIISFNYTIGKIWPVVLIFFAVGNMLDEKKFDIGSAVLLILGGYFLLRNYDFIHFSFMQLIFPVLLILVGLFIMLPKNDKKQISNVEVKSIKNDIMMNAIFSSSNSKSKSKSLKKIEMTAIFGGVELDLTEAEAHDGKCVAYASSVFGGIDIKLPDDWAINVDGLTCILGGIEDKRDNLKPAKNTLYLSGIVVLGGIEIK